MPVVSDARTAAVYECTHTFGESGIAGVFRKVVIFDENRTKAETKHNVAIFRAEAPPHGYIPPPDHRYRSAGISRNEGRARS